MMYNSKPWHGRNLLFFIVPKLSHRLNFSLSFFKQILFRLKGARLHVVHDVLVLAVGIATQRQVGIQGYIVLYTRSIQQSNCLESYSIIII